VSNTTPNTTPSATTSDQPERRPDGYETLLYDALRGDATLFQRADSIEAGWRIVDPILQAWAEADDAGETPAPYPAGSWGPKAADSLPARHGHAWHNAS